MNSIVSLKVPSSNGVSCGLKEKTKYIKGQTKLTFTRHTPNRVNIK